MNDDAIAAPLAVALSARGYETLTPVQQAMLAPEVAGRDALVSAQTGSGKTVAFGMAIAPDLLGGADRLLFADVPMALIIAPTRELALQVARELDWLYAETGAQIATCVGGMDYRTEKRALDRGAHIVVGTPGRLRDHIDRGSLDLSGLRAAVLDEADEMLDLGFREDLEFILAAAPPERRTMMFSATVPPAIAALAKDFQRDALRIQTQGEARQHVDIEYRALNVSTRDREHAIFNVLRFYEARTAIVFCKTRVNVNHLFARMGNRGFKVVALSGELSQQERTHALQSLRDGRARVCIATDVAARGIDLPGLDLVIHADLPANSETLLHRSGRTGRAGAKGVSVLIVTPAEFKKAQRLLQGARVVAEWAKAPSADEVRVKDEVRLLDHAALVQPVTEDEKAMVAAILDRVGPDQAAAAFARLWREGRSAPEELMDLSGPAPAAPKPRGEFGASVWYAINVGRAGRAEARWLLPKICDAGGITKDGIGAIRVQEDETFVQIAVALAPRFGEGMELEPGVTLRRIAGEPNLDAPVKPRAKPREAKPHEPKADRKVYTPKPLRVDEGEAEFAAAPAAAPAPVRSAAPAPRPLREDSAPVPRKPYDPDRKPFDPDRKPFVKRDTVAKPYAKRDDAPKSYAKPHATRDDAPKPYAKRTDAAKPYAKAADAPRKPYVKRDDAAAKPYAKRDGDAPKSYPKRDDAPKSNAKRDDAAAKPYAKPADSDRKPYVKRDGTAKPAARRAEGEAPKPRWQPPKSGGADARPPRPKAAAAAGGKPAFGKAAGSKSHTKPAFGKKPAPRPADPSDTSKRFVPPKKPQG
ncbi:MAG: DEAD/DEAH box helicase [Rhodobacter sp.]|nr:DEAD/DEAH box helicase [Rhodobacter sp.]